MSNHEDMTEDVRAAGSVRPSVRRACFVAFWVCVWQLASLAVGSSILLAGPAETLAALVRLVGSPTLLETVWFSFQRIVGGFCSAYVLAVALALVAHRWPLVAEITAPALSALKSIPIACIIVLLLIWVGSRQVSGIAVFLAVFPAVYFSCAEGLAHVDGKVGEMLRVFGVRRLVRFLVHTWPQTLPYLVGTSRNVCGMAWKSGIAAELIGSPMGSIGERIYQSKILLETADLFAWTIVVVTLSVVCERVFVALLARSDRATRALALWLERQDSTLDEPMVPSSMLLCDADLGYAGVPVVRGVNLVVEAGEHVVLTDASGAGKTTLLRTLMSLQPHLAGIIDAPQHLTAVFQEARLVEELTAVQNVLLVGGCGGNERPVRALLAELLADEALDVPVAELSGGQRRRVEIVRALAAPSEAVLMDEPFASLDAQTHERAAAFVQAHVAGRTLLVASHAPGDARLLSARETALFSARP